MKIIAEKEVGVGVEEGLFQVTLEETRSSSNSRSRSGLRASTNRDRIRCYRGREYYHFVKDCPTTAREKGETEQIQKMF